MRVHAETSFCQAARICVQHAPGVFASSEEDGTVRLIRDEVDEDQRSAVLLAVESCPVAALSVQD